MHETGTSALLPGAVTAVEKPEAITKADDAEYRPLVAVMLTGMFATTFSQVTGIGLYPIRHLFNDLSATRISLLFMLSALPWNLKVFAGLITDSFPLFGTRRRHYLLMTAAGAALLWFALAIAPPRYWPVLVMMTLMNCSLAFASTVSGGLLVEAGQRFNSAGRLSSLRIAAMNIAGFAVPIGAFLAAKSMGITAVVAAAPLLLLFILTFSGLREPRVARRDLHVIHALRAQTKVCITSRMLWAASALLFLTQFAPGFSTPLYKYQTKALGFRDDFIGILATIEAIFGTLGAVAYFWVCRHWKLGVQLYWSILIAAAAALLYLGYDNKTAAMIVEAINFFAWNLAQIPLFALAARATPKGSEALGYSIIMSAMNWALSASDLIGSRLFDMAAAHMTIAEAFKRLV